jgi:hypothetical protein
LSALRNSQALDAPNAGHRWDYMAKLLASGISLSADARLLLFVLLTHDGAERRVNPGLRRLAEMCGMSIGRCMAARDELIAASLITCTLGSGTRSSEYRLVNLDAWFAEWIAARSSVPNSLVSVPDSCSSVHPVGAKPLESSKSEKRDRSVLRAVPSSGWYALVMRAPEDVRTRWLDRLTFHGADADGRITLSTDNPAIAARVRSMLDDVAGLAGIAYSVGIDPGKVVIRTKRHGADPIPPDLSMLQVTPAGMEEAAKKIEETSDTPPEPMPPVIGGNTVSLAAYRTRRDRTGDEARPELEDPDET